MIRLAVPRLEALGASQFRLEGGTVRETAVDALADRLATRLGRGRVRRYSPADTHIPEQAQLELPAVDAPPPRPWPEPQAGEPPLRPFRSEEHTSELQSLMRISYAVFCLKKKTKRITNTDLEKLHTTQYNI